MKALSVELLFWISYVQRFSFLRRSRDSMVSALDFISWPTLVAYISQHCAWSGLGLYFSPSEREFKCGRHPHESVMAWGRASGQNCIRNVPLDVGTSEPSSSSSSSSSSSWILLCA